MACPSKPAGARATRAIIDMEQDRPGRATTRRRPVPRYKQGASHDTGTQTLPGHGRGGGAGRRAGPALGSRAAQPAAASFPYALSDAQWRERLSREEYEVLRREATERLFQSAEQRAPQGPVYLRRLRPRCSRRTASSTAAPAGPASGSPCRTPWARPRTAPSAWSARRCMRQLRRPSGTRVRRRPAPDRPALLHERRRAALHGAELRHTRRLTPKP